MKPKWYCFLAGTVVHTENGVAPVERLAEQELVLTRVPDLCIPAYARVQAIHVGETDTVVHVQLGDEVISTTPEHPFWVIDRGWVRAGSLTSNHVLQDADGRNVAIVMVVMEHLARPVTVYNLTVGGSQTFFVGDARIRVHNKPR